MARRPGGGSGTVGAAPDGPTVTPRQLTWATLQRQHLLERSRASGDDALTGTVGRLVGVQAQEPAAPYVALANRLEAFDPAQLDAAITGGALVKASLMRVTLHLARAEDHPVWHTAMQPTLRGARLHDARFTGTGLTRSDGLRLVGALLAHAAQPRTGGELEAHLATHVGQEAAVGAWWALRSFTPLRHAVTGGPWSFGRRPSYVALAPTVDGPLWDASPEGAERAAAVADAALPALVERYLAGYGPATVADTAQFLLVQRSRVTAAVTTLAAAGAVVRVPAPGRTTVWDVVGGHVPSAEEASATAPPRLLGMWDNALLAYADRTRLVPEDLRRVVSRSNGDWLPTVLVDGQVAGVWRVVPGDGASPAVEVSTYRPLDEGTWDGLAAEASRLLSWAAPRDHALFGRYRHWWAKLPRPERVRLLPV